MWFERPLGNNLNYFYYYYLQLLSNSEIKIISLYSNTLLSWYLSKYKLIKFFFVEGTLLSYH